MIVVGTLAYTRTSSPRLALFVFVRANRRERGIAGVRGGAEEAHTLDRRRLAVVEKLEVGGGAIDDRLAVRVGDDGADLDEVRAAAERRRLRRRLRLWNLRRRVERRREQDGGEKPGPAPDASMIIFERCTP